MSQAQLSFFSQVKLKLVSAQLSFFSQVKLKLVSAQLSLFTPLNGSTILCVP